MAAGLTLAGCESNAKKVQQLQEQYNAEYPAYAKDCVDVETAGSARLLYKRQRSGDEALTQFPVYGVYVC